MEPFYKNDHFVISVISENTLLFKIKANHDKRYEVETDSVVLPFVERKLQNHEFTFRFSLKPDEIKFETLYSKPFEYCHLVSLINEANEENLLSNWYGLDYFYRNSLAINSDALKLWIRSDNTIWIKYVFLDGIQFKLDTQFIVTGHERVINAIKSQISKQSDVMKAKFDNEWKDIKGVIEIKDMEYDVMAKFIDSLHTGRIKNVSACCQNKLRLLAATCDCHYFKKHVADYLKLGKDPLFALKMKIVAKTYNVEFVEEDAKKVLIEKLTKDNIRQVLSYAHKHHDDEIKELAIKYFVDNGVGTMNDVAVLTGISDELNQLKI